jgi:membrane-associated phospholipid phosphatase
MNRRLWVISLMFALLLSCFCNSSAQADGSFDHDAWKFFSNSGTILYFAAGVGLPLVEDGRAGTNHALRAGDALLISELSSDGLKSLIQEKRPDSNDHTSFPSSHASSAFALATVESALHPKQSLYWYTGATLIATSRFALHRHTVGDVLAGSLLGFAIGRLEISSRRGLVLAPLIQPENRVYGVSFAARF